MLTQNFLSIEGFALGRNVGLEDGEGDGAIEG